MAENDFVPLNTIMVGSNEIPLTASAGRGLTFADLIGRDMEEVRAENLVLPVHEIHVPQASPSPELSAEAKPTPKKRAPKAPALDENGDPKPKTPRKRTPKKPKETAATIDSQQTEGGEEEKAICSENGSVAKSVAPKTPRKRVSKAKVDVSADNENGIDGDGPTDPTTPKPTKPRKPRAKKEPADKDNAVAGPAADASVEPANAGPSTPEPEASLETPAKKSTSKAKKEISGEEATSTTAPADTPAASGKKRNASILEAGENGHNDGSPRTKRAKAGGKSQSEKLPTTKAELSEADRTLIEMKKDGKPWSEINQVWSGLTGKVLSKGTLAVRYSRIMANIVDWQDGDIERMLFSKDTIEKQLAEELAVIQKKQEVEKWSKIADHMATIGGDKYTGPAVEKAFNKEKKDNFPHLASVDSVMAGAVGDENTLTKEDPVEGEADVGGNGGNTIEVEEEGSYSIEVERGIEMVNA